MIREAEVRQKMIDVLQDTLPLEDFSDWLGENRRNMHRDNSGDAQALVGAVSLLLYECFDDYRSEESLREDMLHLLSNVTSSVEVAPHVRVLCAQRATATPPYQVEQWEPLQLVPA